MSSVTIKDIAKMASVSCATVSRVLNGESCVKEDTRQRVLALCREHGYRRNLLARSLSAKRTSLIGCIVSDLVNPLFAELALPLEQSARRQGYHMMLCHGRVESSDMKQIFDFLMGHRVDGIILVSSSNQAPELLQQYIDRVPVVLQGIFDMERHHLPVPCVSADHAAGGRMAAEYLYRLGHRKVLYLGVRESSYSHVLRYQGFAAAAASLGMSVRVAPNPGLSSNTDVGYQLAKQFFFDRFEQTAIFAACDSIALGVMAAAREFHISIPEELSLLGFDNISYSALPNICLSTFDPDIKQLAETTMTRLIQQIEGRGTSDTLPRLVRPVLVERETCRQVEKPIL